MHLGNAIKLLRTRRGLLQSELATKAGISVSYLSLLERGKRDPNFSTVEQIASGLDVPLSVLVFLAADREELEGLSPELQEKLSYTAFRLIDKPNGQTSLHQEPDRID